MKIIPPLRTTDVQGQGHYHASRGNRLHNGVDIACWPDSKILSPVNGRVSKIGYPYDPSDNHKGHLRYVEIVSEFDNRHWRIFYVDPWVATGDSVTLGQSIIGTAQDLMGIYKGITPHVHVEIKVDDKFIDPTNFAVE